MSAKIIFIWDYDSALGQINSTMPYNFNFRPIYEEIENAEYILASAKKINIKMTFAIIGFAAEESIYPFGNSDQIRKIFSEGHEIASHSWKHEWFPYLTEKQIFKSLERSKSALEKCLEREHSIIGFVPPHSRPMSWFKKYSFSLGDRALYPFHKGGDMGYILKQLSLLNYKWCRVLNAYKPVWEKIISSSNEEQTFSKWEIHHDIVCVPQHYTGFDDYAQSYLEKAVGKKEALVIVGHPAALSREKSESKKHFDVFMNKVSGFIKEGKLQAYTVSDYIEKFIRAGEIKN
jgi:peptidoglycan/xylan/chitin deacetylase (PgdA/CDA1 family)